MTDTPHEETLQELHDVLEQLEASVETPFVPGEMEGWMTAVKNRWQQLLPLVHWVTTERHPQQYAQIRKEDEGLAQRVAQMREEDSEIQRAAAELDQQLPKLQSGISSIEPDEAKLKPALDSFVTDMLNLIIRIRTQEQSVRTWLQEAYVRDRGTVD